MAKETEFDHPPRGHLAPLIFDSVAKKWYAIKGSGYDYLKVDVESSDLPDGAATALKQLPDGHNVTVDNPTITVVTQDAGHLLVDQHQYDGDTWRKSNLLWGYYDRLLEKVEYPTDGSTSMIYTTAVPAGEVHVVTNYAFYHTDTLAREGEVFTAIDPDWQMCLRPKASITNGVWYTETVETVLKEGDQIRLEMFAMVTGKVVYLTVWGYKMKINM